MKNIIDISYKRQGDSEIILTGHRVTTKMDNNPDFTDLPPEHAEAKELLPKLQDSASNAKGRDIEDINDKNVKKARLIVLLTILAKYVTEKSKGDRGIILSSGFLIAGDKSNQDEPVVEQLDVLLGPPGQATTLVKRVKRARAYMHQYTTEPPTAETVWASEGSKDAFYTFNGLNSTAKYWFRVVVIGKNGERIYSPVVTKVIQ